MGLQVRRFRALISGNSKHFCVVISLLFSYSSSQDRGVDRDNTWGVSVRYWISNRGSMNIVKMSRTEAKGDITMRRMSSTVELPPPVSRRDHQQGPATAPVTLVEYGDYECPYCGMAYPIVKEVQRRMRDQMRFVFRHFPLVQVHPHAESAAEAAEAAGAQGKFWEMHDTLYEHQRALEGSHLVLYAVSLGLDRERFIRELTSHA